MVDIYDAIRERENKLTALQAQISTIQTEIKALQIAVRILEGHDAKVSPELTASTASTNYGLGEKARVWP